MRINTNTASLSAQSAVNDTNKNISSSLEKLGTGLRINKASDDASGLAIADKLRTQASSIGQGIANGNSASALIQIADKAMAEQSNILDTVKTKLIQAGTSTTSADGRESIRKDVVALLEQFDAIASQTNYNGTTLLQKSATSSVNQDELSFQLGEDSTFDVKLVADSASNTKGLGGGANTITEGTNIMAEDSLTLKNTANAVTVTALKFDDAGAEKHSSNGATDLDINVTGSLGTFSNSNSGSTVIDLSSQSAEVQALAKALGGTKADLSDGFTNAVYSEATQTLTITSNAAIDLSALDLSDASLKHTNVATAMGFKFDKSEGLSITNNTVDVVGAPESFLNVATAGGTTTGGDLLSNIKNLAEGELTSEKANDFMTTIDEAMNQLNKNRADFGSTQNQIESSLRGMAVTQVNLKAAESVIRDVDYASESANFNKMNIMAQAGTYAISQANSTQQNVMTLLR